MTKELPEYEFYSFDDHEEFCFTINGREFIAKIKEDLPNNFQGNYAILGPEDMNFTVLALTDGNTEKVVSCTQEIRSFYKN